MHCISSLRNQRFDNYVKVINAGQYKCFIFNTLYRTVIWGSILCCADMTLHTPVIKCGFFPPHAYYCISIVAYGGSVALNSNENQWDTNHLHSVFS